MLLAKLTSEDITTIWTMFFIATGVTGSVIAICVTVYYSKVHERDHLLAMKKADVDLEEKRFKLQREKNREYDRIIQEG